MKAILCAIVLMASFSIASERRRLSVNTYAPVWDNGGLWEVGIPEATAVGTEVVTVTGSDQDPFAPNNRLHFSIVSGNTDDTFALDANTGVVTVAKSIDVNNVGNNIILIVRLTDQGLPETKSASALGRVVIAISDFNGHAPIFTSSTYTWELWQTTALGSSLRIISAVDLDVIPPSNTVTYSIGGGNDLGHFSINSHTGAVTVITALTGVPNSFTLTLVATDGASPALSGTATLVVHVKTNENPPIFLPEILPVTLSGTVMVGDTIAVVYAKDIDPYAPDNQVSYSIHATVPSMMIDYVTIDSATGRITNSGGPMSQATDGDFEIHVTATDGGTPANVVDVGRVHVTWTAADALCEVGSFMTQTLLFSCEATQGTVDVRMSPQELFQVATIPQDVYGFNFEITADFDLDIKLMDGNSCIVGYDCVIGRAGTSTYESMEIYFSGDDEDPPVAEQVRFNSPTDRVLELKVYAYSMDDTSGTATITYSWDKVDPCPENNELCAPCTDYTGCTGETVPYCDGSTQVQCVAESNDHSPTFSAESYTFTISYLSPMDFVVGSVIASDLDGGSSLTYTITNGNDGGLFKMSGSHLLVGGALSSGVTHSLVITVTDSGNPPLNGVTTVTVIVRGDINAAGDPLCTTVCANGDSMQHECDEASGCPAVSVDDPLCICMDLTTGTFHSYVCTNTIPCSTGGTEVTQCLCADGSSLGTPDGLGACNNCPSVVGPPSSACLCSGGGLGIVDVTLDDCLCPSFPDMTGSCTCHDGSNGMLTAEGCTGCPAVVDPPHRVCLCANGELGTPQLTGLCGCDDENTGSDASVDVVIVGPPTAVCLCSDGKTAGVPMADGTCTSCCGIEVENPIYVGGCTCPDGASFGQLTADGCTGCATTGPGVSACLCENGSVGTPCTEEMRDMGRCASVGHCDGCSDGGDPLRTCGCSNGNLGQVAADGLSCTGCGTSVVYPPMEPGTGGGCTAEPVLTRRTSRSACTLGVSFGCHTPDTMWVNHGCKGEFSFNGLPGKCKSSGYAWNTCKFVSDSDRVFDSTCTCPDGTHRESVGLTEDLLDGTVDGCLCSSSCSVAPVLYSEQSVTKCVSGLTYGCVNGNTMKVWNGCRGHFWFNGLTVECNSFGFEYKECSVVPGSPDVRRYVDICMCPDGTTGRTVGNDEDTLDGVVDQCSCSVDPCLNKDCSCDPDGCYATGECVNENGVGVCRYTYKAQGTVCVEPGVSLTIPVCNGAGSCIENPTCEHETRGTYCEHEPTDPSEPSEPTDPDYPKEMACPSGTVEISHCETLYGVSYTTQSCIYYCITLVPEVTCTCHDGSEVDECSMCPPVPCSEVSIGGRSLESSGVQCCSGSQSLCSNSAQSCMTDGGVNMCVVSCTVHADCDGVYTTGAYCAAIANSVTGVPANICYPTPYCLMDRNAVDGVCPDDPCLANPCSTTNSCEDQPTCTSHSDGSYTCNAVYKSSGVSCPHTATYGAVSQCDGSGGCIPHYHCGGGVYVTDCGLCLTTGGHMKCRGQCAMVGSQCVPDRLGCNWLKINDATWVMDRIDLGLTNPTFDECVAAVQADSRCDTSVVQYDRDMGSDRPNHSSCLCIDIYGPTGHLSVGDSDLYYCYPASDCVWKADYNNQWCSNRIQLSSSSDLASCKEAIDLDDRCKKNWIQNDFGRDRCKCLPQNQNCVWNNGDSQLLYCYNNQVFTCNDQGAMVVSSSVYVDKFNFNVNFRLFMSVTVDSMQVTNAAIFEARDGTSNIRVDVMYQASTSSLVISACSNASRRRLCLDCVNPPSCTLQESYVITKGVEYDITIMWTGGRIMAYVGLSSENLVTGLGDLVVMGTLQGSVETRIGMGHDSSVMVCGNEDGLTFKGTVKSLDYRTDWMP